MRFQHVLQSVYAEPWSITVPGWRGIHSIVLPYAKGQKQVEPKSGLLDDDGKDWMGQPAPEMDITMDGVAIIPVKGPLILHAGLLEKKCGACSYDDIKRDLQSAFDQGVVKAVLDIASPGGMCVGNQETADYILELREQGMRIEGFSDSQACSAAYNLAAACDAFSITRTAFTGSIGTLLAILDCSEEYKQLGLSVDLFVTGKYKGTGTEGLSLTPDQREYLQGMADKFGAMFKENVQANRPQVDAESMQGQSIIGSDALAAGLVDAIVDDIQDVLDEL